MRSKGVVRNSGNNRGGNVISRFLGSCLRATVRYFKNLPSRTLNLIKRRINELRHRPKRTEINKVYVLVGYTNKKHVNNKYNVERSLILLRRGLLAVIFVLLMIIAVNRILDVTDFDEFKQIFGIQEWSQITENDPFKSKNTPARVKDDNLISAVTVTPAPKK